jgi:hypothetical protein
MVRAAIANIVSSLFPAAILERENRRLPLPTRKHSRDVEELDDRSIDCRDALDSDSTGQHARRRGDGIGRNENDIFDTVDDEADGIRPKRQEKDGGSARLERHGLTKTLSRVDDRNELPRDIDGTRNDVGHVGDRCDTDIAHDLAHFVDRHRVPKLPDEEPQCVEIAAWGRRSGPVLDLPAERSERDFERRDALAKLAER